MHFNYLLTFLFGPTLILALPSVKNTRQVAKKGSPPPTVNTFISNATSLGEDNPRIQCSEANTHVVPQSWHCVNTLQEMPMSVDVEIFVRREPPLQYLAKDGKCFIIVTMAGDYDEAPASFMEVQLAATQLMHACERPEGGFKLMVRTGGEMSIKEDRKIQILMSKPPHAKTPDNLHEPLTEAQWSEIYGSLRGDPGVGDPDDGPSGGLLRLPVQGSIETA